jgi:hypothetical protein
MASSEERSTILEEVERGERLAEMARQDHYRGVVRHCVMCGNEIPTERKWDAVTCSPECTKARRNYGRSRKDQAECRYCNRPSTPEERALFGMWRKWQKKGMADETFAAQVIETTRLVRENERLKRRLAELQSAQPDSVGSVPTGNLDHAAND